MLLSSILRFTATSTHWFWSSIGASPLSVIGYAQKCYIICRVRATLSLLLRKFRATRTNSRATFTWVSIKYGAQYVGVWRYEVPLSTGIPRQLTKACAMTSVDHVTECRQRYSVQTRKSGPLPEQYIGWSTEYGVSSVWSKTKHFIVNRKGG